MESALLMMNVLAVAVLVFTSLRNDRLRKGQEPTGPFAFRVGEAEPRSRRGSRPDWAERAAARNAIRRT